MPADRRHRIGDDHPVARSDAAFDHAHTSLAVEQLHRLSLQAVLCIHQVDLAVAHRRAGDDNLIRLALATQDHLDKHAFGEGGGAVPGLDLFELVCRRRPPRPRVRVLAIDLVAEADELWLPLGRVVAHGRGGAAGCSPTKLARSWVEPFDVGKGFCLTDKQAAQ